jgi:hypothetical protein
MHDMKEEISQYIEILKNNQSEMNSSIFQVKISVKSLVNKLLQKLGAS